MSSSNKLSDCEDNPLPNAANDSDTDGHGSDEAIEDSNVGNDDGTDDTKKRKIDPKTSQKRVVRNPQPKLDAERLKGPKGIHTIEQQFVDFKFRGKGHEKSDLNKLMKKLEYWSHRLFPKFEFDDCLTKLEALGAKKPVQTHLNKIRLGMLTDDDVVRNDGGLEDEEAVQDSAPIDDFDALIAEELEKQRNSVTPRRHNASFQSIDSNETPARVADALPNTQSRSSDIEITADMKEKMERNRQIAIQKRLARIEAEGARKKTLEQQ